MRFEVTSFAGLKFVVTPAIIDVVPIVQDTVQVIFENLDTPLRNRLLKPTNEVSIFKYPWTFHNEGVGFEFGAPTKHLDLTFIFAHVIAVHPPMNYLSSPTFAALPSSRPAAWASSRTLNSLNRSTWRTAFHGKIEFASSNPNSIGESTSQ